LFPESSASLGPPSAANRAALPLSPSIGPTYPMVGIQFQVTMIDDPSDTLHLVPSAMIILLFEVLSEK